MRGSAICDDKFRKRVGSKKEAFEHLLEWGPGLFDGLQAAITIDKVPIVGCAKCQKGWCMDIKRYDDWVQVFRNWDLPTQSVRQKNKRSRTRIFDGSDDLEAQTLRALGAVQSAK